MQSSPMSSSSDRPTAPPTAFFTSGGAAEETHFTPKLMVAVVGCLAGFLIIVLGFWFVSRHTCCARNRSRLPLYHHTRVTHRGDPTADIDRSRCRLWPFSRLKTHDGESITRTPVSSPPPPYARALSQSAFTSPASPSPLPCLLHSGSVAARADPRAPDFPPPAYIAFTPSAPVPSLRGRR
ncbi:hypothetical protein K466DRAFT_583216 [Polyporus arcularius HHB13444]|uniref:Uncharacterized protein n=1 Tax=Polyporus arcularius HHB13444 TaxID=1314778 RepID=A0A5C3PNT9_9APHY|nr:hypothetical protein K466DRAFT_583216 [Polyporus arcularius HHB13444]